MLAPIADVGYTKQHDIGRIYAIDKVGKDKVTTTFVENVPETADAERVIRRDGCRRQQADFREPASAT